MHVAHAVIDGVIDTPKLKELGWKVNEGKEDGTIKPDAIADAYYWLHTQPRSAWTQEIDIRPFVEKW